MSERSLGPDWNKLSLNLWISHFHVPNTHSRELFFSSFEGIPCDRGYTTKVNFPLSSLDNNFLVTHSQPASKVCFMKFDGDQWSVTYARLKEPPYYPLSLWWDQVIPESLTIVFKVCLTYIRTPVDNGDLRFNVPNNCPS